MNISFNIQVSNLQVSSKTDREVQDFLIFCLLRRLCASFKNISERKNVFYLSEGQKLFCRSDKEKKICRSDKLVHRRSVSVSTMLFSVSDNLPGQTT